MKFHIANGFYRIGLNIEGIPCLGVVFPTDPGEESQIDFSFVLPMGWKNRPTILCTVTETIADLDNKSIQKSPNTPVHHLDQLASTVPSTTTHHTIY